MKILVCSDLHLGGSHYRKFDKDGVNQYMLNNFRNFEFIVDYCINNKIEAMIIPGDIFDKSNVSTVALYMAKELFNKLKVNNVEVFAIKGNHDKSDILDIKGYTPISFILDEEHRFENKSESRIIDGINFVFTPWGDEIDINLLDNTKKNILVAHGYPKNYFDYLGKKQSRSKKAYDTNDEGILPENITKKFDMVLTGHYHTTDEFKIDNTIYINPGSISPSTTHTKNKQHIPCFYLIDTNNLNYEKVEIEGSTKIIKESVNNIDEYLDNIEENNIYRLRSNEVPNRKSLIRAQRKALDIQIIVEKETKREIEKIDDFWDFIHKEYPIYEKEFKDIVNA